MATLFNTKIKDTYQSLLKLEDNTILTTTTKNITDGLGNASPLYMSTTQVRIGSTSASALYWDNVNNRLGIGIDSPTYNLQVNSTGTNILAISSNSTNNNSTELRFVTNNGSWSSQIRTWQSSGGANQGLYIQSGGIFTGGSINAVFNISGNTFFGNTLTPATARVHVQGSGSTSATTALLVQNSSANTLLQVLDNGLVYVGTGFTGLNFSGGNTQIFNNGGSAGRISFAMGGVSYIEIYQPINNGGGFTSGTLNNISTPFTYTNTSGAVSYNLLSISPGINNTGTYVGTIRGIYYNPSLTSLVGTTHIALETVTGNVILGSTSGNLLLGTTTDNGAKLRIESGNLSMTGYQPIFNINGTITGQSYIKTNLAIDGTGVFGGIGMNTDIWLTPGSGSGGVAYNIAATMHFKVNGTNPLTSATSHWLAGDNGKNVGYQFLTTHYRSSVPAAWYGPEISGGIVGLQQFNIGYEPKQFGGAGFTFVGVGLSGVVTDPFTRVTEFNPIRIDYSLASGGSNITARGVYYKPAFTSVYPLLVNNAFESTSGSLVMSGEASRVSSTVGRAAYLNQTLRPANMTGDTLIGLDINPTFTSSATQISTFTYVGGSGYTLQTTWTNIPLTGGTGTGATVNITVGAGYVITVLTLANRGTGYTVNDVLTLPAQNIFTSQAGGSGFSVTVTAVGASTYNSYGLLVRNGSVGIGTSTPSAQLNIKGSGSTSATSSLLVQNSGGTQALNVRDDGSVIIGNTTDFGLIQVPRSSTYAEYVFMRMQSGVNLLSTYSNDGLGFKANYNIFDGSIRNNSGSYGGANTSTGLSTQSYNFYNEIQFYGVGTDSSLLNFTGGGRIQGGAVGQYIKISGTLTLDSLANIVKGFFFNPTLTGTYSTQTVFAIHSTYGGAYLNTATPQASAILQADSTTQGVLFPRMTTTQKNAIASPVGGLVVYDTTTNKLCCYNGTTWNDLF